MKSKIHTIPDTQYAIRTFRQLNSKIGNIFKGKITKSFTTFSENKPNSPIVQINVTSFTTMIYAIFASLTKVKNKPNQTQYKPNTNPIPERPKMDANAFSQKDYEIFIPLADEKTKPIQTQNKPNFTILATPRRGYSRSPMLNVCDIMCLWRLQFKADSGIIIELLTSDI